VFARMSALRCELFVGGADWWGLSRGALRPWPACGFAPKDLVFAAEELWAAETKQSQKLDGREPNGGVAFSTG
jgi:hypothetical protein